jgi:hypothetical protein
VGSILDRYEAVPLDMNGTFMFGPSHDNHATSRGLGGARLTAGELRQAVGD